MIFFLTFISLACMRNLKFNFSGVNNDQDIINNELSILGHLSYKEISKEKLVFIEPNIEVNIDMSKSLLKIRNNSQKIFT